jgi:hypothetical protein
MRTLTIASGLALLLVLLLAAPGQAAAAHPPAAAPRPSVSELTSLPETTIVRFPLVPSGLKNAFPTAAGAVTIVRGDHDHGPSDTVTVDVWNLPPRVRFTIFYTELAGKPFGNVEYVRDLTTRADGRGEAVFDDISFNAFAMDARHPGTSVDAQEGLTSGTNLEHLGLWFGSLADAKRVLNDDSLTGTIFDGGTPPMHAGPQALTDAQPGPAF